MTPVNAPATSGRARVVALFVMFVVVLSACSSNDTPEQALDTGPFPTKDASSPGQDPADEPVDVTTPPVEEGPPDDQQDDDPPASPPGTVNDLTDLIGNESDEGLGNQRDGTLVDRFVVAIRSDTGDLDVSESDARCAGEMLDEQLSPTSFELLVTNLETLGEIENGNQFTDAELTVISQSLASCIDFRPLVDEAVSDDVQLGALVGCLAGQIGIDGVETLFLFELLGENGDRLATAVFLAGLDLCPGEARAAIDEAILSEFLLADAPAVEACLAGISSAELRPFFESREFSVLIAVLRDECLF